MENEINNESLYYLGYNIFSIALEDNNINDGIEKSLIFTKGYFKLDDIFVYKLSENGKYVEKYGYNNINNNLFVLKNVLNKIKYNLNKKKFQMTYSLENMKDILFIPILSINYQYVIVITGNELSKITNNSFVDFFINTMSILIDKAEMISKLTISAKYDLLTGLNNRNEYERVIKEKKLCNGMIYGIFDIFRLKIINDNYSHEYGDEYIKKTSEILKKHFPQTLFYSNEDKNEKTGFNLYRIGGDEFVLISDLEKYENIMMKIEILQDEVSKIALNVTEPLGINYGIVVREDGENFKDLYLRADKLLSENKNYTYKVLGLDRRKK